MTETIKEPVKKRLRQSTLLEKYIVINASKKTGPFTSCKTSGYQAQIENRLISDEIVTVEGSNSNDAVAMTTSESSCSTASNVLTGGMTKESSDKNSIQNNISESHTGGCLQPDSDDVTVVSDILTHQLLEDVSCNQTTEQEAVSPDLFDDDTEVIDHNTDDEPDVGSTSSNLMTDGLGTPISAMNSSPTCLRDLGALKSSTKHAILVNTKAVKAGLFPRPYPGYYVDKWDHDHVRLPCSPESLYPVNASSSDTANNVRKLIKRWDLICDSLKGGMKSGSELAKAILKYNSRFESKWDFSNLINFFDRVLDKSETKRFFEEILPNMIRLALDLPNCCTQAIPLLKKQSGKSLTMSQKQVSCLLANAFLCTFPRRNSQNKSSEYATYPEINFKSLYVNQSKKPIEPRKIEKLKCLLNYFKRVTDDEPLGTITFHRQRLDSFPDWMSCNDSLPRIHVLSCGKIEDQDGLLQVDFANKFIGGGVLHRGCVQEEIYFMLCPELLVTRLFTEVLDVNECLVVTGCERYNATSGYSDTFRWQSDFVDTLPSDSWSRRCRQIVAIDATRYSCKNSSIQYKMSALLREINKAYVGFYQPDISADHLSAVATGNWGCGAFNGDNRLKFLVQLIAAGCAHRDIVYFTFGDDALKRDIHDIHCFLVAQQLTIGDVMSLIRDYYEHVVSKMAAKIRQPPITLYNYVRHVLCDDSSDTDIDHNYDTDSTHSDNVNVSLANESNGIDDNKDGIKDDVRTASDDDDDEAWLHKLYGVERDNM